MSASSVSVTQPVGEAIEHVKEILFRPFNLGKWFVIGFCAWLAILGEGGGGFNFSFPSTNDTSGDAFIGRIKNYLEENLSWIIPVAIAALLLIIGLWVLFTWLNSRGKFMFLHCVAHNKAEITIPWHLYVREGNSLFRFRLILGALGVILLLPLLAVIAYQIYGIIVLEESSEGRIALLVAAGTALVLLGFVWGLVNFFTTEFVIPIMFLRKNRCREAWGEFLGILSQNRWNFTLYVLFYIVLTLAVAIIALVAVVVTCCIAGCILALPYLGTVLMLPILVFYRSYSAFYLAQYGPGYNVFLPPLWETMPPPSDAEAGPLA